MGLAYIAAHLSEQGHEVSLIDLNLSGYNPQRLRLALKRAQPGVVGISTYTETYPNAVAIADDVKAFEPAIRVVFGGVHPSVLPLESLSEPSVDYVVVGEGEHTTAELVAALEGEGDHVDGASSPSDQALSAILGLGWKHADGDVVLNPPRPLMLADEIGWPARDLLSLEFYENAFNVLTARGGCPYRCPFCSASHVWEGNHRPRSPRAVVDEVEHLVRDLGATHVYFGDDIFTLRRSWVMEMMVELERLGGAVTWACSTRVDRVDEELLAEMARHGCISIQFGIESGAQEVLDSVKGIQKDEALEAVRWSVSAGIDTTSSFMVPFPQDTEATLRETFDFMDVLNGEGSQVLMSYTTPYPGTKFYDEADALGLKILTRDWGQYDAKHLVMETEHFTVEDIERLVSRESEARRLVRTA